MAADPSNWRDFFLPEIISGGAYGVDFCAEVFATRRNLPFTIFKAEWDTYGKRAGFIRNAQMAEYADALIAVWDGSSRGTAHMIKTMEALGKPVFVYKTSISESKGAEAPTTSEGLNP
jgi:hypothetical protein